MIHLFHRSSNVRNKIRYNSPLVRLYFHHKIIGNPQYRLIKKIPENYSNLIQTTRKRRRAMTQSKWLQKKAPLYRVIRINSPKPSILFHPTIFAQLDRKSSNNSEFRILRERKSKSKAVMTSNEWWSKVSIYKCRHKVQVERTNKIKNKHLSYQNWKGDLSSIIMSIKFILFLTA